MARALILVALAALAGSACSGGSGEASPPRASGPAAAYKRELAALSRLESEAIGAVAAVTGARYQGDAALLGALRQTALPRYREYLAALDQVAPATPELVAWHARLRELGGKELALLERLEQAVARGDGSAVLRVNREQHEVRAARDALLRDFARLERP